MYVMSSHSKKDSLSLIIDVQSSTMQGSLVLKRPDEIPRIVWTSIGDIQYRAGSAYLIKNSVKAVQTIASSAHIYIKDFEKHFLTVDHISKVHIVLSSPWITSEARTISRSFKKETVISRSDVQEMIEVERGGSARKDRDVMVIIEEKVFDVRLNVEEWEGATAQKIEVSCALSWGSTHMIRSFTDACIHAGLTVPIDFHSALILQYIGRTIVDPMTEPCMFIDVHGELTDVLVATPDSCVLFASYPIGIRILVRDLARTAHISVSAADSLVSLYEHAQIDALHGAHDTMCIQKVAASWVAHIDSMLSQIPIAHMPHKMTVSSRVHELFFKQTLTLTYPHSTHDVLSSHDLASYIAQDPHTERSCAVSLQIIAIHTVEIL
jgi:cell division ATPase FtsA